MTFVGEHTLMLNALMIVWFNMIYNLHQNFPKNIHIIKKKHKNNGNKNNKKTFSIKRKDVGMSKPKNHENKVRRLT